MVHGCTRAASAGVRSGMPLAQARALLPRSDCEIVAHDPRRDRRTLERLALIAARRLSPTVGIDTTRPDREPDGLLLDITGCAHLFGGETGMLEATRALFSRLGFISRGAIAPSIGCAWALAHAGESRMRAVGSTEVHQTLAPLPTHSLRLDPETVASLADTGIRTIGELLHLPRAAVAARFGQPLLQRLDQALGRAIETIEPIRPVPPPMCERLFAGPTDRLDAIELAVRGLLGELADLLRSRGVGARELAIELLRSDLEPAPITITLGRPSLDPRHLWTLARPKLERTNLGFGVEGVRVHARAIARTTHEQATSLDEQPAGDVRAIAALCDTLANRLGHERVLRAHLQESHLPERAFAFVPTDAGCTSDGTASQHDRPTVLLSVPELAEVVALTPDGPVHRVRWRGEDNAIIHCRGPERLCCEWWRSAIDSRGGDHTSTRDYFAVQTEHGQWLWLCRSIEQGKWYVHGVWA